LLRIARGEVRTGAVPLQAQAMGAGPRQFRAFDREGLTREFAVPPHWAVSTITEFGVPATTEPHARGD
jgi:hypothetical protein